MVSGERQTTTKGSAAARDNIAGFFQLAGSCSPRHHSHFFLIMKVGFIIAAFAATVQAFAPSSTNGRTTSSSLAMAMERTYIMIKPVSVWFEYVTCGGRVH